MGIYLNPGNRGFWQSIRSEIYVDKTGLIAKTNQYLNTEQQYICVSRPRRFGKSMALKMLAAYYSRGCDSGELFAGYKIAQDKTFKEYLNQYDVICPNMQQFLIEADPGSVVEYLEQEVLRELRKEYADILEREGRRLAAALAYMTGILPLPHTDKPALVVELKYDKTADAAIRQIKDRQYTQVFDGYRGEILLTEINYNSGDKDNPQSCVIEKQQGII